jgi:hypothetical protein
MRSRFGLLMVPVVAVLALGACSSGDDSSSSGTTLPAAATTAETGSSATETGSTGAPEVTSADTTDAGGDTPVFTGDANSPWCSAAKDVQAASDLLDGVDFTDPDAVKAAFDEMGARMQAALPEAPDAIRADVEISAEAFQQLRDALAAVDYDFINADLSVLDERSAELGPANDNIDAYNEQVCGIVSNPGATDGGSSDTPNSFDPSAGTVRDQAVAALVQQGFTQTEAECLFDNIDFTDPEIASDPSKIVPVFDTCGIDLARLAELGG